MRVLAVLCLASAVAGVTCESPGHPIEVGDGEECVTCHLAEYQAATSPVHVDRFPLACEGCHDQAQWRPARFDHAWPLEGAHASVMCASCHPGDPPDYTSTPTDCVGCHADDRARVTEPDHATFSMDCSQCHGNEAWRPARFDHAWPLEGAHASVMCASCHPGDPPRYNGTPTECVGCHAEDRAGVTQPDHATFSMDCSQCHTSAAWRPAAFDHAWPLEGAHASALCASCHPGDPPRYSGTPTACVDCHAQDRAGVTQPDHATFSMDCSQCHTSAAWRPAAFDHAWPLEGAHASALCASCHPGDPPRYSGTPTACVDCHRADYDASPYPGHADFPLTCDGCHTTSAWRPATGGGHPEALFPIQSGAHSPFTCTDCHNAALGPNGKGNADCVGCHTGEHTRARMDGKHNEVSRYPTGDAPPNFCLDCHADGRNRG